MLLFLPLFFSLYKLSKIQKPLFYLLHNIFLFTKVLNATLAHELSAFHDLLFLFLPLLSDLSPLHVEYLHLAVSVPSIHLAN